MNIEDFDQEDLLSRIQKCFDPQELEQLAFSTKFVRRSSSRLTGLSFLMMNVFDSTDGKERSLNDSCDWLDDHFDIKMTKQSLDERYNTDAVRFLQSCFTRTLQIVNEGLLEEGLELPFSKIQLTDSTSFQIPADLAVFYQGYKGNGGKSILKMHLNYDFLSNHIEDIFLTDGSSNDNNYKLGKREQIQYNALYIRDLGYFDLNHFRKIDEGGGYFLSHLKVKTAISIKGEDGKLKRIEIGDYLPKAGLTKEVKQVYIGTKKKKLKARLIIESVPEEVAEKRLKKLDQYESKHKGKKVSKHRREMCYFNFFITNIPSEILSTSLVRLLYTIRWQIELVFKIWKSVFKIDKVKKMSIFRFQCYIYSKLIAILLTCHIQSKLGQFLWDNYEFELSPIKSAKLIKKK